MSIGDIVFVLTNIYAPKHDNPDWFCLGFFFRKLFSPIDSHTNQTLIMCGDYSLVYGPLLDYRN